MKLTVIVICHYFPNFQVSDAETMKYVSAYTCMHLEQAVVVYFAG